MPTAHFHGQDLRIMFMDYLPNVGDAIQLVKDQLNQRLILHYIIIPMFIMYLCLWSQLCTMYLYQWPLPLWQFQPLPLWPLPLW